MVKDTVDGELVVIVVVVVLVVDDADVEVEGNEKINTPPLFVNDVSKSIPSVTEGGPQFAAKYWLLFPDAYRHNVAPVCALRA